MATDLIRHSDDAAHSVREPEVRLRTATGRWLVVRATWLRGQERQIAVVLEPAIGGRLASRSASPLTTSPRPQERIAAMVLQGRDTRQIVAALHISQHTVQEHLKAVFDKFGLRSRRELVTSLLTR